jgi:cation diffusion facilitator CzcD-associated flavoprotein CzcO
MTQATVSGAAAGEATPEGIVRDWLARFGETIGRGDVPGVVALMSEYGMWKDVYALTWDLTPARGREEVAQLLTEYLAERPITDVEFDPVFPADVDDLGIVRALFTFNTDISRGRGVLRLVKEGDRYLAFSVSTELRELLDHPRPAPGIADATRDEWNKLSPVSSGLKASVERTSAFTAPEYTDHDPDVVIVGGGQAGLILAARMNEEGLDVLVVDKYVRAGDSWRQRYDSLKLHDSKWYSQLPYLPYPSTWPLFTPKNSIADWLEVFVWAMGVKLWTESPAVAATYDAEAERWEVTIDRQGVERKLRPRHLVFATGFNRLPVMPEVPGADEFEGYISHSAEYRGSTQFKGKKVLVVGTGSSGMDLAKDAVDGGAEVTMLQRGPTYIMSTRHGVPMTFGEYYSETSPPDEISDSLGGSLPLSFMMENWPHAVRAIAEQDRDMIAGLKEAGFEWYAGPGDAGLLYLSLHKGGGYYIDNGAADLIITGKIAVQRGCIERFTRHGVVFDDGTEMDVDAVVFSTGFENMRETFRPILGDDVTDGLATVWGMDEKGELRTTFRHTGHPRLWAFTGGIQQSRFHSRPVAVMIKAIEAGLVSADISVKLKASEFWRTEFDFAPPPDAEYLHDVDGGVGA